MTAAMLAPALPEIVLAICGMVLLLAGVFGDGSKARTIGWGVVASFAVTAVLVLATSGGRVVGLGGLFVTDPFAVFVKVLILLASAVAVMNALDHLARDRALLFEVPVLILFATLGMLLMVSANDLIALYVGIELQSLSLYVVAAVRRDTLRSTEAGLKYFVLGALSSGMLLYGCSLIYGFAGATGFEALAKVLGEPGGGSVGVLVGVVFLVAGLAFKVSAVPFHMWTPDVYEGAPTPVTALFAVAPKVAAIALFIRVMVDPLGALAGQWQQILVLVSIGSMVLGSLAAISQTNLKRLLAYSSIGHMGYALVGLAAANEEGVRGILVYMALYLFMTAGTFAVLLAMRRQGRAVEAIGDLAGLSKTHPMMAVALTLFMFSMAGVPPLAGFFGKFYVFMAAVNAELYVLAVIGVLASVVGAFYYLRIVKIVWFDVPEEALDRHVAWDLGVVMTVGALVTGLFIIWPAPLLDGAAYAAGAFFPG